MDKDNKIELLSCPRKGKNCNEHLYVINNNFSESIIYQGEKNYRRSVELLKNAFDETFKLQESTCLKCAALYRSTIIETLENTHKDLRKMTKGFFRTNKYKGSYIMADNALNELKQRAQDIEKKNGNKIAF